MEPKICIVGLGYVGIQLACEFVQHGIVYGYDINEQKIYEYKHHIDKTNSVDIDYLDDIHYITDIYELFKFDENMRPNTYIVCVPTPVDDKHQPDLTPLKSAIEDISKVMVQDSTVIFESTVAPKTTREICIPLLEKLTKLKCDKDFYVGFSPERLQPGRNGKRINEIVKLISGSSNEALNRVYNIYHLILPDEKIHKCSSLEVAETSKIMENVKRDVNIALMNEFQMICSMSNIDFDDVLASARTKFNFDKASYNPGMVGGHCIGVDPYYFIEFEKKYVKDLCGVVQSARTLNENVPFFLANMILDGIPKEEKEKNVLILGYTFKENCNDIRNTKVKDLRNILANAEVNVFVCDNKLPYNYIDGFDMYSNISNFKDKTFDCIFIALNEPSLIDGDIFSKLKDTGFVFDYKGVFKNYVDDIYKCGFLDKNNIPFDKIVTL